MSKAPFRTAPRQNIECDFKKIYVKPSGLQTSMVIFDSGAILARLLIFVGVIHRPLVKYS